MEERRTNAGKHNIVNTYIWDGDGGLRTEEQSFAATVENTASGEVSASRRTGSSGEFGLLTARFEYALVGAASPTEGMSRTESDRKSLALNVDLSGLEHLGITVGQLSRKVDALQVMLMQLLNRP